MPGKKSKIESESAAFANCLQQCSNSNIRDILKVAVFAAKQAGAILLDRHEKPHHIQHKGTIDIVTEADLASEKLILDILGDTSPGIRIMSEESFSSYRNIPDEPVWIIDPLDGTTNFAHNFPWFSVSIAFFDNGKSQAGVIYCPMQNELFCSTLTGGAWLNNRRINVSDVDELVLDRAYLKFYLPQADITAGRQRIAWGAGYIWNPTDAFNPLSLAFAVDEEQEAEPEAVRVEIPLGELSGIDTYVVTNQKWSEAKKGIRAILLSTFSNLGVW